MAVNRAARGAARPFCFMSHAHLVSTGKCPGMGLPESTPPQSILAFTYDLVAAPVIVKDALPFREKTVPDPWPPASLAI